MHEQFRENLREHLDGFTTAPFLFVGSGFSRRYADTEDWSGLLRRFAEYTGKPYARYSSSANGDLPLIAELIGEDFHDLWWDAPEFEGSRNSFASPETRLSPLKFEVSSHLAKAVDSLPLEGDLADELELLRDANIEGIITTNFDGLLEYLFPEFTPYIGQDELLFKDPQGVAEIYKIHGSVSAPESLVLTASDFDRFNERNAYLAAKLLTIFVEHPVMFLGYSLSDENVRQILTSIVAILTSKNLDKLKDRLLFVNWQGGAPEPTIVPSSMSISGVSIPIHLITASSFDDIFRVLTALRRRFPARLLRHLKEQVYELARTSEPTQSVVVADFDSDTDVSQVDVVIGVGVSQQLSSQGVVGLKRRDLLKDVLTPFIANDKHAEIVDEVLPALASGKTHVPIYRYLRGANCLDDDGSLRADAKIHGRLRARVRLGTDHLRLDNDYYRRKTSRLLEAHPSLGDLTSGASLSDALLAIPALPESTVDVGALRQFLLDNQAVSTEGSVWDATQWVKCVCFYDYLANRLPQAGGRRGRRSTRSTRSRRSNVGGS